MKLIGYTRVSTVKQVEEGVSLDAQQRKLEMFCELFGHELVTVYTDAGESGAKFDRPQLELALKAIKDGKAEGLIISKLDRLTRSVVHLGQLIEGTFSRYALVSVDENIDSSTATGRLIMNILMSVSQWEREVIGERTREAMQHKKSQGEFCGGGVPYGYRLGSAGELETDDDEWMVVDQIKAMRNQGKSYRDIASDLSSMDVVNRKSKRFHPEQIRRICA